MKIIYTTATGIGYIEKESEDTCTVRFLHKEFYYEFPVRVVYPYLVHNTLYEVILRRKGQGK